jgi:hypothetical protein
MDHTYRYCKINAAIIRSFSVPRLGESSWLTVSTFAWISQFGFVVGLLCTEELIVHDLQKIALTCGKWKACIV